MSCCPFRGSCEGCSGHFVASLLPQTEAIKRGLRSIDVDGFDTDATVRTRCDLLEDEQLIKSFLIDIFLADDIVELFVKRAL